MPARKDRKANELYLTRTYDAPVQVVWDAWTDPVQVAKWWGPRGFTITHISKDLRPGGHWKYTMHGPDGKDWPNKTIYHEVEPLKKLVYDHGGSDDTPPLFRVTVLFSELRAEGSNKNHQGQTKLEFTMAFKDAETAKESAKFIKQALGDSTWDRLAEYLEKGKSGKEKFVIARTFHTDVATMREMWVNPKHFAQWLSPTGTTMEVLGGEIQEGASLRYAMSGNGLKLYGRITYRKLGANELVYTQQFLDEKGGLSRHPMLPTWPETMLTTVRFLQEDEDHCRVMITWEPEGEVSREELDAFVNMRGSMTMGWQGSLDKLEEKLGS